jgi:hypothetical protein
MLSPAGVYRYLAQQPPGRGGAWLVCRKPLLVAFVLGCSMSLLSSARLTLRLAGPATIYWSFVPIAEIMALGAVCWRDRRTRSFLQTIDLFFAGYGPWLLWLVGLGAIWCFVPPVQAFVFTKAWLYGGGAIAVAWSAYIDFCFFRYAMGRSLARAGRDLFIQRLVSWMLIICIFGGPALPPEIAARL